MTQPQLSLARATHCDPAILRSVVVKQLLRGRDSDEVNTSQTDVMVDCGASVVRCTTSDMSLVTASTCDACTRRLNAESLLSRSTEGRSYSTTCQYHKQTHWMGYFTFWITPTPPRKTSGIMCPCV